MSETFTLSSFNPYLVLGTSQDADMSWIKHRHRMLSKWYHPDKSANYYVLGRTKFLGPLNDDKYARVQEAFRILSDEELRAQYDAAAGDERYREEGYVSSEYEEEEEIEEGEEEEGEGEEKKEEEDGEADPRAEEAQSDCDDNNKQRPTSKTNESAAIKFRDRAWVAMALEEASESLTGARSTYGDIRERVLRFAQGSEKTIGALRGVADAIAFSNLQLVTLRGQAEGLGRGKWRRDTGQVRIVLAAVCRAVARVDALNAKLAALECTVRALEASDDGDEERWLKVLFRTQAFE
ncbi:hypothetical protein F4820DRAFT_442456 [Hypoxylon rubiginosum]|uniref:Uncharacterized protein n=1 Tax=Hypoxylon rubiginosum TaxID=110542 RepID=A0ACB9ZGZ3_9PEZI|nr:hypothetical protein F4820DRAFT_442456 [Hypoxylon rubiginosum]